MSTHGSQYSGGYQFMRSNAATLQRGTPLLRETVQQGARTITVDVVPLLGGRPETYDITCTWTDWINATPHSGHASCIVHGTDEAHREFAATIAHLKAGGEPGEPR